MTTLLQLVLLGGFKARAAGRAIEVPGRKERALLAFLAMPPGEPRSRDRLAGLLWSERADKQAHDSLKQAVLRLRKSFDSIFPLPVLADREFLTLDRAEVVVDVAEFEQLIGEGTPEAMGRATTLYHGDLLDGLDVRDPAFEEWLLFERQRLRDLARKALAILLDRHMSAGAHDEAGAAARRLLALDPLREIAHRALMRIYAEQGQTALALKQYQLCRDTLQGELGVKPEPETTRLYEAIRQRRATPEPPSTGSLSAATDGPPEPTPVELPSPPKPSIAVLPFVNMSGDPEQEYFADGITEDIITELSRFRNLLVIARDSSFAYKGKSATVGTIAHELGVEYVLKGSVRRAGQRVRITAQLINATSGSNIWAERYDRELTDIFLVQDDVSLRIVGALAVELEDESLAQARQKPPESLQAYDHWLRGKRLIFLMGENNLEARSHFERAATLDPNFSRAHSGLALTYQMEALDFPLPRDFHAAYEKSFQCAKRAAFLDDTNHQAHLALAYAYLYRKDCEQAKKHIERAIKCNPSDGDTLSHAAWLLAMIGEPHEAIKFGEVALRLNPHHPDWYFVFLSTAMFTARRYPEAHAVRSRAPDAFIDAPFFGAATLAHMARLDEARRWADKAIAGLARTPGGALAIAGGRVVGILLDNNPYCREEDRDHFADGMRKAGIPG